MGTLGPVITAVPTADTSQADEAARVLAPLLGASTVALDGDGVVDRVLALARVHLGLDISWFSRFDGDVHVFEHVSGDGARFHVGAGMKVPAAATYCSRVVAGELPNVIPDTLADERTRDLPITQFSGAGAYDQSVEKFSFARFGGAAVSVIKISLRTGCHLLQLRRRV